MKKSFAGKKRRNEVNYFFLNWYIFIIILPMKAKTMTRRTEPPAPTNSFWLSDPILYLEVNSMQCVERSPLRKFTGFSMLHSQYASSKLKQGRLISLLTIRPKFFLSKISFNNKRCWYELSNHEDGSYLSMEKDFHMYFLIF